ncbi:MAG: nitrous oxide reductase family maturation protein NosD [Gemmatimonadales bacterium]
MMTLCLTLLGAVVPLQAHVLTVAPGSALPTLGRALALAIDGDTIRIRPGTYAEPTLTVARRVVILGEGWPILDAGGDHEMLRVTADSVTIRGLVIRNVGGSSAEDRAAIRLVETHGCLIEDNTLLDNAFGIYLQKVTGCTIRGNRVRGSGLRESQSGNAIHSWSSSGLVVEDNILQGHRDGIYFEFTTDAHVRRNTSSHNLRYGLHFMFSHGCEYEGNSFLDNHSGVAVMYSHDVIIRENHFERSRGSSAYGLLLKDISDSRVERNQFVENSAGLYAEGTTRVEIRGNAFLRNGWGVQVMANAQGTRFLDNRFEGNSFDVSTNGASAASVFLGNRWDRYTGYDLDRDGYGDIPFAPVRLFALVVQQNKPALILLRSFFVSLLDAAERVAPVLTPATMLDRRPRMSWAAPGTADR